MATSSDNLITLGLKGALGRQLVFRKRGNKLIVAKMPAKRKTEIRDSEKEVRRRFKEASTYAKAAIKTVATKEYYLTQSEPGQTAYNMAFADFFSVPEVSDINLSQYAGKIGDKISLKATEDFKVISVWVEIFGQDGSIIESGDALMSENELDWFYTVKKLNGNLIGTKIVVSAKDLAGNSTVEEKLV